MKITKTLILITALLTISIQNIQAEEHFRRASSDLENKLDEILINAEEEFKLDNKNRNYNIGLTHDLVEAIFEAQTSAELVNCNGQPVKGEQCDLGYIPVICAKTSPASYYYNTEIEDSYSAVINVSSSEYGDKPNQYKMVNEDGEWKIDSVECSNGDKFN